MTATASRAGVDFDRDGFYLASSVLDAELVERARRGVDAVVAGHYDTGNAPNYRNRPPTRGTPDGLVKIDQAHRCNRALLDLVRDERIGAMAAAVTGAERVQLWATQLLVKPSGIADQANVGWHQDNLYWNDYWDGVVFTAWVALSDVTIDAGPLRFVAGSHRWGFERAGDFHGHDLERLAEGYDVPDGEHWREVAAVLTPGGVSMHHRLTIHGSGPNVSGRPRVGLTIHLCTEQSEWRNESDRLFGFDLTDMDNFPVLWPR